MTYPELDATGYSSNRPFYNREFEELLSKIVGCYHLMILEHEVLENEENKIRDILLLQYLKNNKVRGILGLKGYLFDREVQEDRSAGRTDIKIQSPDTFENTEAYYTIECKRLDATNMTGHSGLNAKYIENGICRFVLDLYSSHHKTNGMIGFVVTKMNIHENTEIINNLLKENLIANSKTGLVKKPFINEFEFSYCSLHSKGNQEIILYHLMLDVSTKIK